MTLRQRFERALAELANTPDFPLARPPEPPPTAYAYVVPDLPEGESLADWTSARSAIGWPGKDAAFDKAGGLTRPLVGEWRGDWTRLQTEFARQGLTVRLETEGEDEDSFTYGRFLLSPRSGESCELREILAIFDAMRASGVVALPNAGDTNSDSWEDVGGVEESEDQPAVHWHSQAHESAFDAVGQLRDELMLGWRGDAAKLAEPFSAAGFPVSIPTNEDTKIAVLPRPGAVAPPIEPLPPRAPAKARPTAPPEAKGFNEGRFLAQDVQRPVTRLLFSPDGKRLAIGLGRDDRGPGDSSLRVFDVASGTSEHDWPWQDECAGAAFLPDGRLLAQFLAYRSGEGTIAQLDEWVAGRGVRQVLDRPKDGVAEVSSLAVDAAGKRLFLVGEEKVEVRAIGGADEKAKVNRPGVIRRAGGAVPAGPAPWETVKTHPAAGGRLAVASTPDGRILLVAARDSGWVQGIGEAHWNNYVHRERGVLFGFGLDPDARIVGGAVRVFRVGGSDTHFGSFDVRTGKAGRPEWAQRAAGLTAFALGRGVLVAAFPDATVRVFGETGAERARLQLRGNANVTALALDAARGRLAIGRARGEVAVYTLGS